MQTGVFIGRFQPFHDGHKRCIQHVLSENDRCIVLVRETQQGEKNPLSFAKRKAVIRACFPDDTKVIIQSVDDPGARLSVYIGRDVGYDLIQLDEATESISGTDLRKKMYDASGKAYKKNAPDLVA